jgi:hypothetical protein
MGVAFYHGSNQELKSGTLLLGYDHEEGVVDSAEHLAEELALMTFDLFRPQGAIARQEAIYLSDRAEDCKALGAWGEAIYEVEALGEVQRYNAGWFDLVFEAVLGYAFEEWERGNGVGSAWVNIHPHEWPSKEATAMCSAYWAGQEAPSLAGQAHKWEYLCKSARVIGKVTIEGIEATQEVL